MKFYITIVAFFIGSLSFAQNWELGAKGGINIATANLKNSISEFSPIVGFHLGGYANTQITDQVSLQPEALFSLQGWKSKTADDTRILSYFQVPIAVKYSLTEKFNVHAGPQLGFLISVDDDLKDHIKSTDFGAIIGAEYKVTEAISAGIRYNLGINNIFDNPESSVKIRSRVLQLTCGYRLTR